MADFLLELLSEEIPARMQARAVDDLVARLRDGLKAAELEAKAITGFVTPRRLGAHVEGLPAESPSRTEERRGPRTDAPEKAIEGFLRGAGLASLDQCEARETPKGTFWFVVIDRPGRPTPDILAELVGEIVRQFPWPKSMRWAGGERAWVRPLHGILAVLDGRVLPGEVDLGGGLSLPFTNRTCGHRFLAPEPFEVADFQSYREGLRRASVLLDREMRMTVIRSEAQRVASERGLKVQVDEALVEEVAGLVEYPVAYLGQIDAPFMALPAEVRTTTMRANQKYFATLDADGRPAPHFVVIANRPTEDGGAAVVRGNERVLRARLADARFFWDQDLKTPLDERLQPLQAITFHEKLGTMADKVGRLEDLALRLCEVIPGCDRDQAYRAARLAKADLVTGMVGEFPELQGIMGGHYARAEGLPEPVADAIASHYRPAGPGDLVPSSPVAVALALADRIDNLTGFFGIGEMPTGSRDPFALRRAALGVIRIIVENRLRLELAALPGWTDDLSGFIAERLKVILREEGVRHDLIDAVFALGAESDIMRLLARVAALQEFLASEDGANLLAGYRRAANIVRIEAKKDGEAPAGTPDPALLRDEAEQNLFRLLKETAPAARGLLSAEDFAGCMGLFAQLRGPIDSFFEAVTVNADDPALRHNRLKLLNEIRTTLDLVARFDKIEG